MKLKYINQLTEPELKDLLLSFAQSCYGATDIVGYFRCKHFDNLIYLEGMCNLSVNEKMQQLFPIELALDDYQAYSVHGNNLEAAYDFEDEFQKFMRAKFGKQYTIDWFKNY